MPKPEIIRTEVIRVINTAMDDYGNLKVQTADKQNLKVAQKRDTLFKEFDVNADVEIGWATYMDKEYVATARKVSGGTTKPQNPSVDAPQSKSTPLGAQGRPITPSNDRDHLICRQVAFKAAVELCCQGKIPMEAVPFRTEYYNKLLDGTIKYSEEGVNLIEKMDMTYALEALAKYNKKTEAK